MTPTGLTKDAGWEIGVSRTFPVRRDRAWAVLTSDEGVAVWLGPGSRLPTEVGEGYETADGATGELRSLRPLDRVRLTWQPAGRLSPTIVQVVIRGDDTKTSVRIHQDHLADADERGRQRAHWQATLERLAPLLQR
ncbi:MAG: activator of ATPase 1 family protein [Acidimicrobiales bacterium]|nr:activator of ATPase 1 family protein [Acidimicrobiales bacterium]